MGIEGLHAADALNLALLLALGLIDVGIGVVVKGSPLHVASERE